jgi:hypothetical protein
MLDASLGKYIPMRTLGYISVWKGSRARPLLREAQTEEGRPHMPSFQATNALCMEHRVNN